MSETAGLVLNLVSTTARMGPVANARLMVAASLGLPFGLPYAGAQGVIQGVEAGQAEKVAKITALLVKISTWLMQLSSQIVENLVDRQRADTVAQVCLKMISNGDLAEVTQLTSQLITDGRLDAAMAISGQMIGNGELEFMNILNDAKKQQGEGSSKQKGVVDQVKEGIASVTSNADGSADGAKQAEQGRNKSTLEKVGDSVSGTVKSVTGKQPASDTTEPLAQKPTE